MLFAKWVGGLSGVRAEIGDAELGEKMSFIWSVADLLRGPYKPNQYGLVILPLTVLRRLDFVLEPTKDKCGSPVLVDS